jgi:phosphoserine phosphatase
MKKRHEVILITVRGPDAPGITSRLTKVISEGKGIRLLDIEQTVVHGKLLLSILLGFTKGSKVASPVLKDMLIVAKELGVNLDFEVFENNVAPTEDLFEYVITCLGEEIGAYQLSRLSTELASHGINIDKIAKLSHGNIRCIEMITHASKPIDTKRVSRCLLPLANKIGVDIAIQKYGLLRQSKRLVVLDMDSTLIQSEVIDELAKKSGNGKKVVAITNKVLNDKMSFAKGLRERVHLLAGLEEKVLDSVYKKIKLTDGAEKFMNILKKLGYKTALISGGFTYYTNKLKGRFGFDYAYANELEIKDVALTGKLRGRIIDTKAKADIVEEIAKKEGVGLDQTIAIGDGANDLGMLSKAGLGIAFRAKPVVVKNASYSISKHKGLDSILFLLGIHEKEVLRWRKKGR